VSAAYPDSAGARDRWILERRPARNPLDPRRAYGAFVESEADESGRPVDVATILLTNRECPWRCLMCDLWKNTLEESAGPGAIPAQIAEALGRLAPARRIKLYNAGSFFDRRAIPAEDHPTIAAALAGFERTIVECHPALVGPAVFGFRDLLDGELEIAMGLETVHPEVLPRLNKGMTLDSFRSAARALAEGGVALRVFVLAGLPWVEPREQRAWALRSIEFAFDCGATAVSLIATRPGNGAMDALRGAGSFLPPKLGLLEGCLADGLALRRGRVFADLWDLDALAPCPVCRDRRRRRLSAMNLEQTVGPPVACDVCGAR
jgi:radical SAM enzyme (TIGR01210 family)